MVCPCTKGKSAEHLHTVQAHLYPGILKRMRTDAVKRALTAGMAQLNAALQHGGECAWVTFSLRELADYRIPR